MTPSTTDPLPLQLLPRDPVRREPHPWSAALVLPETAADWRSEGRRLGWGLALSSLYGMALGARYGLVAIGVQAAGVPLGLAAVAALAAPAFYILLAHAGHPIGALGLAAAVSRATATTGLVLAGLSPAAVLLTATTEGPIAAALYGTLGLAVGGGLGLRRLLRELSDELLRRGSGAPLGPRMVALGFACFATLLAARIWWLAVPTLGGGS